MADYVSPVKILSFVDLCREPINMYALDLGDYVRAGHRHLQKLIGMASERREEFLEIMKMAVVKTADLGCKKPMDVFNLIVAKFREFLMITFQKTSRIQDTGNVRGTSQAMLIFVNMLQVLLLQGYLRPSLVNADRYDTDYDTVVDNLMAVHGDALPIRKYTQSQVYRSLSLMADRFLRLDPERDFMNILSFRMRLLRRLAYIVNLSESDDGQGYVNYRLLDMDPTPGNGYVCVDGCTRQCTPRYIVEAMTYYVQTERLIHMYMENMKGMMASTAQTQRFASKLFLSVMHERGVKDTEESVTSREKMGYFLFEKCAEAVRFFLMDTESKITNDHTAVERLANDIRNKMIPPGAHTQFRYSNYLMSADDHERLEGALYSDEKQYFVRSFRHREMAFFTCSLHTFVDNPDIRSRAGLHMIQQFILNQSIEMTFTEEILYEDYELSDVFMKTPETVANSARGYFSTNGISGLKIEEDMLFEPEDPEVWQLPITMRDFSGDTAHETMPCIIKLCMQFYVYYSGQLYKVENETAAFTLWVLIIIDRCRCKYVRRGRGGHIDLSFLKFFVLQRMNDVDKDLLPSDIRSILDMRLGQHPVGGVHDTLYETDEVEDIAISSLFESIDMGLSTKTARQLNAV